MLTKGGWRGKPGRKGSLVQRRKKANYYLLPIPNRRLALRGETTTKAPKNAPIVFNTKSDVLGCREGRVNCRVSMDRLKKKPASAALYINLLSAICLRNRTAN